MVRKNNQLGFADVYLYRCNEESKSNKIIGIELIIEYYVYKKLVKLDTKLGTTASEQLFMCLAHTTRWDIIKVCFMITIHF